MKWIVILLGLTAGCVHYSSTVMPDGKVGYEISCNGNFLSMSDCMNKAAALCGGTYQIVGAGGQTSYYAQWNQNGGQVVPIVSRNMMVECTVHVKAESKDEAVDPALMSRQ